MKIEKIDVEIKEVWDESELDYVCECVVGRAIVDALNCIDVSKEPFERLASRWIKEQLAGLGIYVENISMELNFHDQVKVRFECQGKHCFVEDYVPGIGAELHIKELKAKREKMEENRWSTIPEWESRKIQKDREVVSKLIACIAVKHIKFVGRISKEAKRRKTVSDMTAKAIRKKALTDLMAEAAIRAMAATEAEEHGVSRKKAKQIAEEMIVSRGKKE